MTTTKTQEEIKEMLGDLHTFACATTEYTKEAMRDCDKFKDELIQKIDLALAESRNSLLNEIESKIPAEKELPDLGEVSLTDLSLEQTDYRGKCIGYNQVRSEILKVIQSLRQDNKETKA